MVGDRSCLDRRRRLFTPVFSAALLFFAAWSASAEPADCADWNTGDFFAQAQAAQVRACLAAGADPNERDEGGQTPFEIVASKGTPGAVAACLEAGSDPNQSGSGDWTPLHLAARNSYPIIIDMLLDAGADPLARDYEDRNPWFFAEENEHLKGTEPWRRLKDASF